MNRFAYPLQEQCIWARTYADIKEPREAVGDFVHRYTTC